MEELNKSNENYSAGNKLLLRIGNFFFRYRNMIFPAIFIFAFLIFTPTMHFNSPVLDKSLMAIGTVLTLLGCGIRLAVIGFAYIVRGGRNKKVYADDLVKTGFYAHCRNPMYIGNILIATGIALIYGSPWMLGIVIPFFIFVYVAIVAAEEDYLYRKFGKEFTEYCSKVPKFLIYPYGMRQSLSNFTYDWRKVLIKEYGTLSSTLAGIVLLITWKMHLVYESPIQKFQIALALSQIALFYISIRILKKSGRLKAFSSN